MITKNQIKIVKSKRNKKNRIKNSLEPWILAIGDATIGHRTKQKVRHQAQELQKNAIPYLKQKLKTKI